MRKEVWFGLSIMALVVTLVFVLMPAPSQMTNGHLGLLMLALIVVGIMLGFPTAFTLMGMGVFFGWLAYHSADPTTANRHILDLMVQLNEEFGTTVIMVTHDPKAARRAKRMLHLEKGAFVQADIDELEAAR